jgi:hypothetical protein
MTDPIETRRRFYAEELRFTTGMRSARLQAAFATVPRERFVGDGPWRVKSLWNMADYRTTRAIAARASNRYAASPTRKMKLAGYMATAGASPAADRGEGEQLLTALFANFNNRGRCSSAWRWSARLPRRTGLCIQLATRRF